MLPEQLEILRKRQKRIRSEEIGKGQGCLVLKKKRFTEFVSCDRRDLLFSTMFRQCMEMAEDIRDCSHCLFYMMRSQILTHMDSFHGREKGGI